MKYKSDHIETCRRKGRDTSIIILFVLLISTLPTFVAATNGRTTLPVTVAPTLNGALLPNSTWAYNFVFSASQACTSLLNVSTTITTNTRGIGSADLNITSLSTTPSYICEYVNGTLRKIHPVFSSMFENRTADVDILAFGYNHTSSLDSYFIRNSTIPTCSGTDKLTSAGNGSFTCAADQTGAGGNSSFNQTHTDTIYYPKLTNPLAYYNSSTLPSYASLAYVQSLGNWSADKSSYNTTTQLNALYYGITNPLGYYNSSTIPSYATVTSVQTLGNWSTNASLVLQNISIISAQIASMPNLSLANINTNLGNWSADKSDYNTTASNDLRYLKNVSIPTCTGSDKLTSAGNGVLTCATDDTSAGGYASSAAGWTNTSTDITTNGTKNVAITGTLTSTGRIATNDTNYVYGGVESVSLQTYSCDYLVSYATTACYPYYFGAVVGTSGISAVDATMINESTIGVYSISGGTATNSGYRWMTDIASLRLYGNEEYDAYIAFNNSRNGNDSQHFFGFIDTVAVQTAPADGAYFWAKTNSSFGNLVNVSCYTANNSVRSNSGNITLPTRTWYLFMIKVNSTATGITCDIYNRTGLVWEANVSGALPNLPGRETGAGYIGGNLQTPGTAHAVAFIDMQTTKIERKARPVI